MRLWTTTLNIISISRPSDVLARRWPPERKKGQSLFIRQKNRDCPFLFAGRGKKRGQTPLGEEKGSDPIDVSDSR